MNLQHPLVSFIGRLLIVYIFATSGLAKILDWSGNVQYMSTRHLPLIPVLLTIARVAAFIMFLYLTTVTVLFHNYWAFSGNAAGMQETHFRKNLAIMGGLLMIAAQGPGRWALGRKSAKLEESGLRAGAKSAG
jgi:putative oxidoreductase